MVMGKNKRLSVYTQNAMLKGFFPDSTSIITNINKELHWEGYLRPTAVSLTYKIKISYRIGSHPDVYILSPKPLQLAKGKNKLEHIYDHKEQRICLYPKNMDEWSDEKIISYTIIPWTCEWLMHYEFWVVTGVWKGGGIH